MIPLVAPCITDTDRTAVAAAAYHDGLTSDRLLREYEEAFAERVGCAGAVAVASGTAALALALEQFVFPEHLVPIPSYACSAVANAVRLANGVATCRDGTFDVRTARMTHRHTTVKVHAFGNGTADDPRDLLMVPLVEDYTLSLGAIQHLWAPLGVCSTHASKMISTGRGGVVFGNDEALLSAVRESAYYDSTPNGTLGAYSLGLTSMQAALGLSQLAQLDEFIERRRTIACLYSSYFHSVGIEAPDPYCGSVFFRYLIGVDNPGEKVAALAEHGIEAGRGVYPPLHRQLGLPDADFPGATDCVNRLLSVPCHPSLSDSDIAYVAEKVLEVCA